MLFTQRAKGGLLLHLLSVVAVQYSSCCTCCLSHDLCDLVAKMTMPASITDARSMPQVLTDNLCVEKHPQLTAAELRAAITTWLNVEDDPAVLEEEIDMEMQAVENDFANLEVDSASSEEEDGDGRPESCITSSLTEADVRSRFEEFRSYLYANGKDGEYRETLYLLSRSVHSFTHETRAKRKAREGGETQATLRDL